MLTVFAQALMPVLTVFAQALMPVLTVFAQALMPVLTVFAQALIHSRRSADRLIESRPMQAGRGASRDPPARDATESIICRKPE